jgi:hypothetical protein
VTFGSRQKGARAELAVAKLFQAWWDRLEPGCIFRRTPGSGGWSKGAAQGEFNTAGDLVTSAEWFPWTVEIKARESWSWKNVLTAKKSPVWSWWEQAQAAAAIEKKDPLLVFRHNREPWFCMIASASSASEMLDRPASLIDLPIHIPPRGVSILMLDFLLTIEPSRFALDE